jgi:hypothetical protein
MSNSLTYTLKIFFSEIMSTLRYTVSTDRIINE